jgi:hypothetical protein
VVVLHVSFRREKGEERGRSEIHPYLWCRTLNESLGRPGRRWKDDIKTNHEEI